MEAIVSRKDINDYSFTESLAYDYIIALQALHAETQVDEDILERLRKAGLYSNNKLRVFNYKKKGKSYTISPEVRRLFKIWSYEETAAPTWFKRKHQVEAMQLLVDRYGYERMRNVIYILVPIGNEEDYISSILNPQELLDKYGKHYTNRFKSEDLFNKHKELMSRRAKELQELDKNFQHLCTNTLNTNKKKPQSLTASNRKEQYSHT